jgi:hypothetical protein
MLIVQFTSQLYIIKKLNFGSDSEREQAIKQNKKLNPRKIDSTKIFPCQPTLQDKTRQI